MTNYNRITAAALFLVCSLVPASAYATAGADIKSSPDSLALSVPPFRVDGVDYPGGEVTALPGIEQILVFNLKTLRLHVLPRSLGDGEVPLARLSATGGGIAEASPVAPVLPPTRIPRTLKKLAEGEPVQIVCLGTSLVEMGTAPNGWQNLLFNPQPAGSQDFRIPGKPTVVSHAVGGTNARYTATLVGQGLQDGRPLASPVFESDLVIVALLPNGGTDRLAVFEGVVRLLRERQVEVLLLTDNSFAKKGDDGLWRDGVFVRRLADRYGCAVADTAAYMREGELRGETVYRDSIHQAAGGHLRWAEAIAGVLAPGVSLASATPTPAIPPPIEPADKIPGDIRVDFTPKSTGASPSSDPVGNRLAKVYGVTSPPRTDYPAGATLTLAYPGMSAIDLIIAYQSDFVAELRDEEGRLVKTISQKRDLAKPEPWMRRSVALTVLSAGELKRPTSATYRLTITRGALQFHAVSYHTPLPSAGTIQP